MEIWNSKSTSQYDILCEEQVTIACRDEGENSQINGCVEKLFCIINLIFSFKGKVIIKQVGESNGTADRLKKLELPSSDSFLVIIGNPDFSVNLCNVFDKYRRNRCCCSIVFKKKAEYRVSSNEVQIMFFLVSVRQFLFMASQMMEW